MSLNIEFIYVIIVGLCPKRKTYKPLLSNYIMKKQEQNTKQSVLHKAFILSLLKEKGKMTKSQLAKELNVSRPTIYHHLGILKERDLIKEYEPDSNRKGSPVFVSITEKADPLPPLSFVKEIEEGFEKLKKVFT